MCFKSKAKRDSYNFSWDTGLQSGTGYSYCYRSLFRK